MNKTDSQKKLKLLFICNVNVQRSPTAEDLFSDSDKVEAKSAGIHPLAVKRINQSMIDWADEVFVMSEAQDKQLSFLEKHFDISEKSVFDLGVSDIYARDDPELIKILKEKLNEYLAEELQFEL